MQPPSSTLAPSAMPEHVPTRILGDARCHLGEGPAYDAATDTAWWFDILGKALFEAKFATGTVRRHELPVMASALAFVGDARQLLVAEDGLYLRGTADGRLSLHRKMPAGPVAQRSNDARVHPSGTLWFSTMGRSAQAGIGAIHVYREGRIETLFSDITVPNAICFSPDGGTGYFADTRQNILMGVPLDPATGLPLSTPAPLFAHEGPGGLDGAVTDADGLIWCAHWGGGCVAAYAPDGRLLKRLHVPARQPSCPVFVGPDFGSMLVTTAYEGMDGAQRADDPHHGRTFCLDAGFAGKAEPRVLLGSDA